MSRGAYYHLLVARARQVKIVEWVKKKGCAFNESFKREAEVEKKARNLPPRVPLTFAQRVNEKKFSFLGYTKLFSNAPGKLFAAARKIQFHVPLAASNCDEISLWKIKK